MSEVIDLTDLMELQTQKREADKDLPDWVFTDDKGNLRVSASKLGYKIMKEVPMIRSNELSYGARFDKTTGAWRMDSLSDYLDGHITKKLESVGKWSQQKLNETKKFIFIKIFDATMKDNPFNHSKPYLANFKNGTYNIKTNEMKPHDIKDYIMQSHNYSIDPQAYQPPVKTMQWLQDLTGDSKSADHLMEMVGYCFYRSYAPFQTITILQGSGENGKSTFLDFLMMVLCQENVSNVTLQDLGNKQNRFASSNLFQMLANIFADVDAEFIKSTGLLKALTGGDRLSAEFKGKDSFMFINFAKLIFSCNELPPFSDFTKGFERRLNVIPFDCVIDDEFKKKHNLDEVYAEIPQFTVYCMQLFNEALQRKSLTISDKMKQAKEKWLKESNHVQRFVDEHCVIDKNNKGGTSSKNIYDYYVGYCFDEGIKRLSQPNFNKQLEKLGVYKIQSRVNGNKERRYSHLFWKNNYTPSKS